MRFYGVFDNLRHFIHAKPPVVLFTLTLLILALGSACIATYISTRDLTIDKATKSWDVFLENLSSLEFCIISNQSHQVQYAMHSPQSKGEIRSFSFPMMSVIRISELKAPHEFVLLTSVIDLTQLGFKGGNEYQDATVEIQVPVPFHSNFSNKCSFDCHSRLEFRSCVTVTGPANFLPPSTMTPPMCDTRSNSFRRAEKVAFEKSRGPCLSGPSFFLARSRDSSLEAYFSKDNKSVIDLHLFSTSFFLFVVIFTIMAFALFKRRSSGIVEDASGGVANGRPVVAEAELTACRTFIAGKWNESV